MKSLPVEQKMKVVLVVVSYEILMEFSLHIVIIDLNCFNSQGFVIVSVVVAHTHAFEFAVVTWCLTLSVNVAFG